MSRCRDMTVVCGSSIRLASGIIAYKCNFQPTVPSSTQRQTFMAAYGTGKWYLCLKCPSGTSTSPFRTRRQRQCMHTTTTALRWATLKTYVSLTEHGHQIILSWTEWHFNSISMVDHFIKNLCCALFHLHGFSPQSCSLVHLFVIGKRILTTLLPRLFPNSYNPSLCTSRVHPHPGRGSRERRQGCKENSLVAVWLD